MAAYYSQPAAANYNTPPAHSQRQRGYRVCDTCGAAETPSAKFRLCSGCVRPFLLSYLIIPFIYHYLLSLTDDNSILRASYLALFPSSNQSANHLPLL